MIIQQRADARHERDVITLLVSATLHSIKHPLQNGGILLRLAFRRMFPSDELLRVCRELHTQPAVTEQQPHAVDKLHRGVDEHPRLPISHECGVALVAPGENRGADGEGLQDGVAHALRLRGVEHGLRRSHRQVQLALGKRTAPRDRAHRLERIEGPLDRTSIFGV
eukprot:scaffold7108_cov129-Isochrysis_galbana.AAC.2